MTPVTLASLSPLPRWVGWRNVLRKAKATKVPFAPRTGRAARADAPADWTPRAEAEAWARANVDAAGGGVGLQLGPIEGERYALGGVDLDTCRDPATGRLDPWAADIVARLDSYAEVSPSGTGVKVFLRYAAASALALRRAMGNRCGRQFKRGAGPHPPAIELHIGNRYFAVTDRRIEGAPAELRLVDQGALLWLLKEVGPGFAGAAPGLLGGDQAADEAAGPETRADPGREDGEPCSRLHAALRSDRKLAARWEGSTAGLRDTSRSGMDMSMMALLKRARFPYRDAKALLVRWPHGAGAENAGDDRYFRRMWERSVTDDGTGAPEPVEDERPLIRVAPGDIRGIVDRAEQALLLGPCGLYQRGPFVVRPGIVPIAVSGGGKVAAPLAVRVGDHALVEMMTAAARWERFDGRSRAWAAIDAPHKMAATYLQRVGHWRLPVLSGIVTAPTLRPDGAVLATPGHDVATGLLFDPMGATFPELPDRPTRADAVRALAELDRLVGTFPFVGGADRAVALSAILTACVRRSLPTAPMHAFTAPVAGSGKSKLVDIASAIATGHEAAVIGQGKDEAEMEKRLGALMLASAPVIAIDNCTRPLGGDVLCQALTQPLVRTRILGESNVPELPSNAFVAATGNNLALLGDMTRRSLLCRLDPKCERPELREFDAEPVAAAKAGRARLVVAALTVLRAYHVAGRPAQRTPLGSFEAWSGWVRGALLWLGCADPAETMAAARDSDPKLDALAAVLAQWHAAIGPKRVSAREIVERATSTAAAMGVFPSTRQRFLYPDFREALVGVAGDANDVSSRRLSRWIGANEDRIVGGLRIVRRGMREGFMTWELQAVEQNDARAA